MFENEDLRNDMVIENAEEVNSLIVSDEEYEDFNDNKNELGGILIGAAIAVTGLAAYKFAPKVLNKVKVMLHKESNETLEEKQTRLLAELAEVNRKLTSTEVEKDMNEDIE